MILTLSFPFDYHTFYFINISFTLANEVRADANRVQPDEEEVQKLSTAGYLEVGGQSWMQRSWKSRGWGVLVVLAKFFLEGYLGLSENVVEVTFF